VPRLSVTCQSGYLPSPARVLIFGGMTDSAEETRDGFSFRAGHAALDLCATLTGRTQPSPRDLLASSRDLDRWLKAAGLARAASAGQGDLEIARNLREAVYALALARAAGKRAAAGARSELNGLAERPGATLRLAEDGHLRATGNTRAMLATLAQDAVRLLGGPHSERIRQCESPTCSRLFLDNSRGGDRRWCSMSPCGNRAKVAEFRRRKRSGPR
jgi:predicted RNA-binding Zn ribbon-like protein